MAEQQTHTLITFVLIGIRRSALAEMKTMRRLVAWEKSGVATTYASRDPQRRVFEIETPKIASTKQATDSILGFGDALSNYLGQHEEFCSLVLLKNGK